MDGRNRHEPETYPLEEPPVGASAGLHARSCTAHFGPISPTTVRRERLRTYGDNGRRSILTSDFWGWRLHQTPDEVAEKVVSRFPEHMRDEIRSQRDLWRDAHPPTEYRRGYNLKTAHA